MEYSNQIVVSDGTLQLVSLTFPYIDKVDVHVSVDFGDGPEEYAPGTIWDWVGSEAIRFNEPLPDGAVAQLQRQTEIGDILNKFTLGAMFNAPTLDENFDQLLYIAQEYSDVREAAGKSLRVPSTEAPVAALPGRSERAGKLVAFDNSGEPEVRQDIRDWAVRASPGDGQLVELPSAEGRANKVLTFDSEGQPTAAFPATDSATELRIDLANPDQGAAMVARAPVCVDSISSLLDLPLGQRKPGITYLVASYHEGLSLGGNRYAYRPDLAASLHDGGRYISPQKDFPADWGDKAEQAAWFTPPTSGLGVFELEKSDHAMCVSDFGVRPDVDCSAALQAAVNYSQFKCTIALDVSAQYSETLVVKTGMRLAGDGYNHNVRSALTTNILRYYGTGDGIRVEGLADLTARNIVLRDFHLVDELGTANRGLVGYDIIGSHVDLSITGFNRTCVVQRYLYYINKFAIFGQSYRSGGIVIGGNINEGTVTFKLISTSETLDTGFMVGGNLSGEGVAASASFNPTIEGSVEQNSGRHYSIGQVRGGKIKIYYESPTSPPELFTSSHAALSRLYSADITVYGSSKSQFGIYATDCRDCSFAGELKGATTADFNGPSGFGLDVSKLLAGRVLATNFTTGSVVGRASTGAVIRNAYGLSSALPTSGAYGVGSQLIYTNSVPPVGGTREIGKIVTRAGSFGTLSGVQGTGVMGESTLTFTAGQQFVLVGDYLALPGNTGAFLVEHLYQSAGSVVARLNRSIEASFTDATITYSAPEVQPITVGVVEPSP